MSALRSQLEAIRASALAQVAMAETILGVLAAEESAVRTASTGSMCAHPTEHHLDAARMGAPGAWVCGDCGHEGGGGTT
mgnify:CR=1 FL=1